MLPAAKAGSILITLFFSIPFILLDLLIHQDSNSLSIISTIGGAFAGFISAYSFILLLYYIAPKNKELVIKVVLYLNIIIILGFILNSFYKKEFTGVPHDIIFIITSLLIVNNLDNFIPLKRLSNKLKKINKINSFK